MMNPTSSVTPADELVAYDVMPEVVWGALSRAANDPDCPLRLMAMATVSHEGKPCNRLLVLRGADRGLAKIWFHTDRRSPKVQHLKARPNVSLLAYDSREFIQIRLDGVATLHQHDALAQDHWDQIGIAVRCAYAMEQGPSEPITHLSDPRLQRMRIDQKRGKFDLGRQNFMVIQVHVEAIDWLQVAPAGQRRALMSLDRGWEPVPLTP